MHELIKIFTQKMGNESVNAVNARDVWEYVESKRQFADWISDRLEELEAVENSDYVSFSQICEKSTGGRPLKEYIVTVSIAKEMAMLERNSKGKEIRRYFIDFEREGKIKILLLQEKINILEQSVKSAQNLIDFYKENNNFSLKENK